MAVEEDAEWVDPERLELLLVWRQRSVQEQLRGQVQVRYAWQRLTEKLKERGYCRSAEQCRNEVCRLVEGYRRVVRGQQSSCKFFELIDNVLGTPPSRPPGPPQASDQTRGHSRRRSATEA